MPSRYLPPPPLNPPSPSAPPLHHQRKFNFLPPLAGGITAAFSLLIALTLCFRKLSRKRTVPSDSKPPHRFSYSSLRTATSSFSTSNRLGQGGFGSVYRGTLPNNQQIAVKLMDAGSLQGEREFQNELFFAGNIDSRYILSVIGFSSDRKRRRMLLVYELMINGSLQDCLLHRKSKELKEWNNRFSIMVDIAKGLEYLHHFCDPPVIHGDIKPSNILLDGNFKAKIGDFGLARVKLQSQEDHCERVEDNGSVIEETESVTTTVFEECVDQSPESFVMLTVAESSPETEKGSVSGGNFDGASVEIKKSSSRKDWWWKQDHPGGEAGPKKDFVTEWIETEINKEKPISEWAKASLSSVPIGKPEKKKKKNGKRLDWWESLDEEKKVKKEKRRPAREWWKEEYCEELARKKKKKKKKEGQQPSTTTDESNYWPKDENMYSDKKKKNRSRSRSRSRGSVDWWMDGFSGELWRGRHNSHDSMSGEIPKSGGISSTPSMRGTVCYIAPEYSSGGDLSEKCDVYSFGVLLLVLIAGRRPLQVTGSPMSEFQRANLLSWARRLARAGKLIELVDQCVIAESLNGEQALMCITVALLCLQKSPVLRPSMKEVVGMLLGDLEVPQLPAELSPSPPSRYRSKSRKKQQQQHISRGGRRVLYLYMTSWWPRKFIMHCVSISKIQAMFKPITESKQLPYQPIYPMIPILSSLNSN